MDELIQMAHGSGGRLMHRLIEELFQPRLGRPDSAGPGPGDDAAELPRPGGRLALTTDAFVVRPLVFPGGDIGRLAACGTVNDLATQGARPTALAAAFILEAGLPQALLARLVESLARAAEEAGVRVVTGDTKVVERGAAGGTGEAAGGEAEPGLFIITAGIGEIPAGVKLSGANARPGDRLIVSGPIAEHGVAVMNARLGGRLGGEGVLRSDCAPLGRMIAAALAAAPGAHALRDPTRGGLATTLVELARQSGTRFVVAEACVPVRPPVRQACELLGLDPLYVACEGRMLAVVPAGEAAACLGALRRDPLGREAAEIGRVEAGGAGLAEVVLETAVGGRRPLLMLEGDPLPRIC